MAKHKGDSATPSWVERLFALQPALVRGFIVTLLGLIAATTGAVVDDKLTSTIINFVLSFLGLGAAFLIRPAVTPNAKVVIRNETPLAPVSTLVPGEATPADVSPREIVNLAYAKEAA